MTSNLGARLIEKATPLGFQRNISEMLYEKIKENVLNELKKTFNPEFLNRVDEIVVFHPLEKAHLLSIIDLLVEETNRMLLEQQELVIEVSHEVKEWIIKQYYQPTYGARPMRRAVQKVIEDPLSEEMLRGSFKDIHKINVILVDDKPVFLEAEEAVPVLSGTN
jgi:ATP-dependent Clp protease ATP-binding subunit ClpC